MDKMFDRLDAIEKKFNELSKMMEDPSLFSDMKKYKEVAKEESRLRETVEVYQKYKKIVAQREDAMVLREEDDPEIVAMAVEEIKFCEEEEKKLISQLKILLLPTDPNDDKNVIVEIRGAVGGDEANIFAGDLYRMYSMYAARVGWKMELLESYEAEMGGFSLISFSLKGEKVFSKMKYESGAHRVQRVPKTESQGRIHTSVATVVVMPEAEEVDFEINESDLRIDTYRSSGAGGQHVNKTDSAVRITHIPTNIVVTCQDGRSQHDNRAKAMLILRTRLLDKVQSEANEKRESEIKSKVGTGERSEKIRTYNYPQNRVTDHRIGLSLHSLDYVMDGDIEQLIDALVNEDQRLKLEGSGL